MIKRYGYEFAEYADLLTAAGIAFKPQDIWLTVGELSRQKYWVLMFSIRPIQMQALLTELLPLLSWEKVPFRLIAHEGFHFQLNAGLVSRQVGGESVAYEPARGLTLYVRSTRTAMRLAHRLTGMASRYQGPPLPGARRVNRILYINRMEVAGFCDRTELMSKWLQGIWYPFATWRHRDFFKANPRLIAGRFIPISIIKSDAKGTIYKSINIKDFSWTVVKMANAYALEDYRGRDMRDRLQWQAQVLQDLKGTIDVPEVLAMGHRSGYAYLAMEYTEGTSLVLAVIELLAGRQWRQVDTWSKRKIIGYFLQILDQTLAIHEKGYIHRDLSAANFLIMPTDQVRLLDFELSYSTISGCPWPPFLLGCPGYTTTNQAQLGTPQPADDLFALGGLLIFLLTGTQPDTFNGLYGERWLEAIREMTDSVVMTTILEKVRSQERLQYYTIAKMKTDIQAYLSIFSTSVVPVDQ